MYMSKKKRLRWMIKNSKQRNKYKLKQKFEQIYIQFKIFYSYFLNVKFNS